MKKDLFFIVAAIVGFFIVTKFLLPYLNSVQSAAIINGAAQPANLQTTDPTLTSVLQIG